MGAAQAARAHSLKMAVDGDIEELARKDTNPTGRSFAHYFDVWRKNSHGGYITASIEEALERFQQRHPELSLKRLVTPDYTCVALVTPFMRRVHQEMEESGEVVFVDGTASVDRLNTVVLPLLCASDAGAAPLGFVFASSQDEACLTAGTFLHQAIMILPPDVFIFK